MVKMNLTSKKATNSSHQTKVSEISSAPTPGTFQPTSVISSRTRTTISRQTTSKRSTALMVGVPGQTMTGPPAGKMRATSTMMAGTKTASLMMTLCGILLTGITSPLCCGDA